MRLHIMLDEKVINRTIDTFESVFPNSNVFIILLNKNEEEAKFVEKKRGVFFLYYGTKFFWDVVGNVNSYSHIIIHYLSPYAIQFLLKINHPSIHWIEWGADLYSGLLEKRGYRLYEDKKIKYRVKKIIMPWILYNQLYKLMDKIKLRKTIKAIKKIKYFVPDSMYDEYPLLLNYYPELSHLCYHDFFYYPIDEVLGRNLMIEECNGNNIIVGNSSALTGNHSSVFSILSKLRLDGRKVIVPLSYGDFEYRKLVIEEGKNKIGSLFTPVIDYLPINEYNKILLSSNIFIYGNWRQEAVGNILVALYLGGKVFLDNKNPLLNFYRSNGLILFDLSELINENLNQKLSLKDVITNRTIVMNLYSNKRLVLLIKRFFND